MNSSLFSICFETDTTLISTSENNIGITNNSGASGHPIPNKDAFTLSTILNLNTNTRLIHNNRIALLQDYYKIHFPTIKLWMFDINQNIDTNTDFEKLVCIILFINGVYGLHYVCHIDNYTIQQQKKYILENIIPNYKLYNCTHNNDAKNDNNYEFILLINTFDSNGNTKTSDYENILI